MDKIKEALDTEIMFALEKEFPEKSNYEISNIEEIFGGADTRIISFEFSFLENGDKKIIPLIFRVYREGTSNERAEREFNILKGLFDAKKSVPRPYLTSEEENILGLPYIVMEKVEGVLLASLYDDPAKHEELTFQFTSQMVEIHKTDWSKIFPERNIPEIENNPFILIYNLLAWPKKRLQGFNEPELKELKQVISWLEENKVPTSELNLIHGDFHANNILVNQKDEFVVIDWSNINVNDYRLDLAFAICAFNSAAPMDFKPILTQLYQQISGKKVEEIEYFMVLASLGNLTRIYSTIVNFDIANENEMSKNAFLNLHKDYTRYLAFMTQEIAKIELPTIFEALEK
ncbi:MAG: phosphotransferase [Candidatus Heimdallarchaeota archaeon]|nr:phosphotransferase [Candidatus Heimdallarchaeota archaeon]MCK5049859.1 phosphotransferase [Candidatus Heimdallarchaeota archaeon]